MLEQARRVRSGSLRPDRATGPLASYLGHGLGHLCDLLAEWLEGDTVDRRAADAVVRFYGLGRMPESLGSIAETLRGRGTRRAVTTRRVQQLINEAIQRAEQRQPAIRVEAAATGPKPLHDPYPAPLSLAQRRELARVLLWAWADAIDLAGRDGSALLLYEHEHGLRKTAPSVWRTRSERQRLRFRAWSMLDVARYRVAEALPTDRLVDRTIGPHFLALTDDLPIAGLDALMLLGISPYGGDLRVALDAVRKAVRTGHPAAPELLGLLRDAIAQRRGVPPEVTSKVLALSAISGRERRVWAGAIAGDQVIRHATEMLEHRRLNITVPTAGVILSDALRAAHESAELSYSLGDLSRAWRTMRAGTELLARFGDPEQDSEPDGWHQQWLLYLSSWLRGLARRSRRPTTWWPQAGAAAGTAADLALDSETLPSTWGLAARQQAIGLTLDMAARADSAQADAAVKRLVGSARRQLARLESDWMILGLGDLPPEQTRQVATGLVSTGRATWRAALLTNDLEAVGEARRITMQRLSPNVSPMRNEKFRRLEIASVSAGLEPMRLEVSAEMAPSQR